MKLPDRIRTVEELDELLSRPTEGLVEFMKGLDGDLMILGAGGKVGPTLAEMAKRAVDAAKVKKEIIAVDLAPMPALAKKGIKTLTCNLLDLAEVEKLPKVPNIVFMAGRKFGSTGSEHLTWAINVIVPYHVARTFTGSRIAAFSTGCVYPVMHVFTGGATEDLPADPVGEYAMSCLGRERMFDYLSREKKEKVAIIRLNYAVELRYGVLADLAERIWKGEPVDITTGFANVIWQGDACAQAIQSLGLAASPPCLVNLTGPEIFSIRQVAQEMGRRLGKPVTFTGEENGRGYLNNAQFSNKMFGYPSVPLGRIVEWTADWVKAGGQSLGKATHFETQNGKY
jgi:nucleoside-diphosphate-sugar epimerase